jgi:hypothetical protein
MSVMSYRTVIRRTVIRASDTGQLAGAGGWLQPDISRSESRWKLHLAQIAHSAATPILKAFNLRVGA